MRVKETTQVGSEYEWAYFCSFLSTLVQEFLDKQELANAVMLDKSLAFENRFCIHNQLGRSGLLDPTFFDVSSIRTGTICSHRFSTHTLNTLRNCPVNLWTSCPKLVLYGGHLVEKPFHSFEFFFIQLFACDWRTTYFLNKTTLAFRITTSLFEQRICFFFFNF